MAEIEGVKVSPLLVHRDERGSFAEIFRAADHPESFRQANHSRSKKGVLRGLHYHRHQADLWYLAAGRAQIALADLRSADKPVVTQFVLDATEPATVYIPAGVAHGFLALTDIDLFYWVTQDYDASDEHGIAWDDPSLAIEWMERNPTLSERDSNNPELRWDLIPGSW